MLSLNRLQIRVSKFSMKSSLPKKINKTDGKLSFVFICVPNTIPRQPSTTKEFRTGALILLGQLCQDRRYVKGIAPRIETFFSPHMYVWHVPTHPLRSLGGECCWRSRWFSLLIGTHTEGLPLLPLSAVGSEESSRVLIAVQ